MTSKVSPQVAAEADRLEAMLDELPLTGAQRTKAWDTWTNGGMPAASQLIASFKDGGQTPAVRYKAAAPGDEFAILGEQIATAARAAAGLPGADAQAIKAHLDQILRNLQAVPAQQVRAGGQISDDEKAPVATKAAAFTPIQQIARSTMPELYGSAKKGPTKR